MTFYFNLYSDGNVGSRHCGRARAEIAAASDAAIVSISRRRRVALIRVRVK